MIGLEPPAEATAVARGDVVLLLSQLSKTFPGTRALDAVELEVRQGEFHALLGGNGSGKSTLIKILAGVERGDAGGLITVGGTAIPADRSTPEGARAAGLRFVHQHPAVFPALSVAENLAVGRGYERAAGGRIDWRALRLRAAQLLDRHEIAVRPDSLVRDLRPAERAMVAIARALQDQEGERSGLLVLDEPTASLPRDEVHRLMAALARFAAAGQTILFVSHRLDEVVGAADRATVLRDGRVAGTVEGGDITEDRLVELIAGRPLDRIYPEPRHDRVEEVALEVKGLSGGPLRDVSFRLHHGEVLGVAGLLGSGRSELLKMVFGAHPTAAGEILLDGHRARLRDVGDAMRAGIAYVPEDRDGEAAFGDMTVAENVTAALTRRYWTGGRLRHRAADAEARRSIHDFLIHTPSERQRLSALSGGNQQKVILARWLLREPRVLLLDEPTQGVDVNARAEIYRLVRKAVSAGCSVLMVTSDFEELAHACDRVVVLNGGRITAEVRVPNISPSRLTELAYACEVPL